MAELRRLPKRRDDKQNLDVFRHDYSYSEILNKRIQLGAINAILIGEEDLEQDLDVLRKIITVCKRIEFKFNSFSDALRFDKNINMEVPNACFLISDGLLIGRENIDLTKLKNIRLRIPFVYLPWGIKFNDTVSLYCFRQLIPYGEYYDYFSINGNNTFNAENYQKLMNIINELSKLSNHSVVDKVALVSDYIQSHTQYIEGYESTCARGTFITPEIQPDYSKNSISGSIESVLNNNCGVCMGIANLSTLLLNNPAFNVETDSIYGSQHVWNRVLVDGKYYYFDNTWNITRTDTPHKDALITLDFSKKYLLFGSKTATGIGFHDPVTTSVYNNGIMSEDDYQNISYESQMTYTQKPFYLSRRKK